MRLIVAVILAVLAMLGLADAQTWQCYSGNVMCAPGSPNCVCTPVAQPPPPPPAPPVAAPPNCPVMTFWNGYTCQVPAPAPYVPQYIPQYVPQYVPQYQQRPEWEHHDHPDHPHQ